MPQLRSSLLVAVIALLSIALGPAPCNAQVRLWVFSVSLKQPR